MRSDNTTLKYVEPAPALSGEEPKLKTTTIKDYDIQQLNAAYKGVFTGMAMMGFMHIYMKYTNPLLIQSIIPVKGAIESNLFKVHVLGRPASGDLKRPWKQGGFMNMGQGDVVSDKKAVEQAEKAGSGGAKED